MGQGGICGLVHCCCSLMLHCRCCVVSVAEALAHSTSLVLCNIMCFASEALEVLTKRQELSLHLHIVSNKWWVETRLYTTAQQRLNNKLTVWYECYTVRVFQTALQSTPTGIFHHWKSGTVYSTGLSRRRWRKGTVGIWSQASRLHVAPEIVV